MGLFPSYYRICHTSGFGILFLSLLMFSACASSDKTVSTPASSYHTITTVSDNYHIMLGFTLIESSKGDSAFIHFQQINPGRIIEEADGFSPEAGDVEILIGNNDGEVIRSVMVKDPSRRIIEAFSESGDLNSTTVEEKSSEFFVRLNYSNDMKLVRLFRIQEAGNKQLLLTQPLMNL
jgi:hypothetical protein